MTVGGLLDGGFRIVRQRAGALLIWTIVQLAAIVAADFAIAALMHNNIEAIYGGASPADAQMSFLFQNFLIGLAGIAVSTILYAAVQRSVIHPTEGGPGWLRLGKDELRLFTLVLLYLFVFFVGFLIAGLVLGFHFITAAESAAGPLQLALVIMGVIAGLYFGTRLSLTFPLSLKLKSFSIDDGWHLTRGHFWTLLAVYLVIFVIMLAAGLLIMLATESGYFSAASQYGFGSPEADLASVRQYEMLMRGEVDASIIIKWVLSSIQNVIGYAMFGGAAATAVQELTSDVETLEETFS